MSTVEHFHVLQTFLFGLILAHFLFAIAKIVIDERKVYWLHIIAVIAITEGIIATYFTLHKDPIFEWFTYGYEFFVFTFLPLGSLFVLAYMLFPTHKEITDYEIYFWDNAFKMSLVFALWIGPFMLRYIVTFDIVEEQFGFEYAMGMVITLSIYFVVAIMIIVLKLKQLVYVIFVLGLLYNTFWLITIRIDFFQ